MLLLLVVTMAVLLASCSLSTPLCDEGDALVAAGQPARALEVYARAKAHGDGCADQGLDTASTNLRQAAEDAARGEAAERAGDIPAASAAYQAVLPLDVTNALAIAGLARLGQKPISPPPVQTQPEEPSWWAAPWVYFLGSVLISALLAGAALWLVERRIASGLRNSLGRVEKQAATSDKQLIALTQRQESDRALLNGLQNHIRSHRALIDTLNQDVTARAQATESAFRQLTAADAAVDRACTQLDRALQLQKERIDHLTELVDLFAQTQAEPTSEVVVWFEPRPVPGEPANGGVSSDEKSNDTEDAASADAIANDEALRVEVNIFAIEIGRGETVEEQLVVQRVIERVMERDDVEDGPFAHDDREAVLTEQEPGPVEEAAADEIVDPFWERVQESWWVTPEYQGLADAAKFVTGVENGWHDLVLGQPAERVALGAGFSPASADVIGMVAAKIALPGDNLFKDARRLLQYTGIALGVASGAAPLANACISSLAHDLLAELTAKAIRAAISHVLEPVRSEERAILAPESGLGPKDAQAQQLHSDLVAAERRQRVHELEIQTRWARECEAYELKMQELEMQAREAHELIMRAREAYERKMQELVMRARELKMQGFEMWAHEARGPEMRAREAYERKMQELVIRAREAYERKMQELVIQAGEAHGPEMRARWAQEREAHELRMQRFEMRAHEAQKLEMRIREAHELKIEKLVMQVREAHKLERQMREVHELEMHKRWINEVEGPSLEL